MLRSRGYNFFSCLFLLLSAAACASGGGNTINSPSSVAFQTLATNFNSHLKMPGYYTIKNTADWETIAASFPQVDINKINFSDTMLIAVFLGEFHTGGYAITITDIQESDDALNIIVKKRYPRSGEMVTQGFSSPSHLVKTNATNKPVLFVDAPPDGD